MDCSQPGSSVHGILQARILEWVAILFSRGSSQPRDWTQVARTAGRIFTIWATREAQQTTYWFSNVFFCLYLSATLMLLLLPRSSSNLPNKHLLISRLYSSKKKKKEWVGEEKKNKRQTEHFSLWSFSCIHLPKLNPFFLLIQCFLDNGLPWWLRW